MTLLCSALYAKCLYYVIYAYYAVLYSSAHNVILGLVKHTRMECPKGNELNEHRLYVLDLPITSVSSERPKGLFSCIRPMILLAFF